MASQAGQVHPDRYKEFNIIYNPDETLTRLTSFPCISTTDHNSIPNQPVFTKDIPLNPINKTWIRLFIPNNPPPNTKLPLILYFYGCGFILGSASSTIFHDFCTSMAMELSCVVLSLEYRRAPESRLPAAYEDTMEAINWVRNQALDLDSENCLKDIVDFSKCYLMGFSAGGNMVYHAGVRALSTDLHPLIIRGLICNQPFFGGLKRTNLELRLVNDKSFPLAFNDIMWELSLPKGSDRDHEYSNPMVEGSYNEKIGLLGRCFVSGYGGDILIDRQMEFAKMLEEKGVSLVTWFQEEGHHGDELRKPEKAKALFLVLKEFLSGQ